MASAAALVALLFSSLVLLPISTISAGTIGVNYGRIADNLPTPAKVVQLLKVQGITKAKIFDTDSTVLSAFSNSGISLTVAMPNELLAAAAASKSYTDQWLQSNILPYYPATQIEAIAVGNEVFTDPNSTVNLVPAMTNLHSSLQSHNLDGAIKISSPVALSALATSYPPSNASFQPALVSSAIIPMLDFLRQTSSYLMLNAYPFFAYTANSDQIALSYALADSTAPTVVDPTSGLHYTSLFDAQYDAVLWAMSHLGYHDIPVVISETGWPTKGDQNEVGAGGPNAAAYNGNLARRVLGGVGSPLRPNETFNVYLFALFNEDLKPGPTSERNYGLFYPDEEKVYDIPLTVAGEGSAVSNGSKVIVVAGAPGPAVAPISALTPEPAVAPTIALAPDAALTPTLVGQTWCVANENVEPERLQAALDYACGPGGAECGPIQTGYNCYNPNSLVAHASYAFNSYYQLNARRAGTCYFGGAAYVVTQQPRFGTCQFPTGY
ncbi:Glucan endo-1,3-beta-glucosidase 13-like protein [Drosera capensis]